MLSLPDQYPEGALLPELGEAVHRMHRSLQAPFPMIATSAIGAISLACQRGYLVERKPGLVFPIGLAFLTMAVPSERKSATDRRFLKPIRDFETRMESQTAGRMLEWRTSQAILNAKKVGVARAITRLISRGEDTSIFEQQLDVLLKAGSDKPQGIRLIVSDANAEAILNFLQNHGNSCGVMVDEGGIFFNSSAAKYAALFASLWSGDDVRYDRSGKDSFTVRSPRLTMSIMVQPAILQAFLANKGKYWRDSGLLSRFLVSYPISTIGFRPEDVNFPITADLASYDARIQEILSRFSCSGSVESVTLKFEESARRSLAEYANFIEMHIRPFGFFSDISDSASKIAENAVRMAALFHVYEGFDGLITTDTLNRAIVICNWHLSEFKRLFGHYPQVSTLEQDALDIERCIREFHEELGYHLLCRKNRVSQYGANSLRKDPQRRTAAFIYLRQTGRIQFETRLNDKTTYVKLTSSNFGSPTVQFGTYV